MKIILRRCRKGRRNRNSRQSDTENMRAVRFYPRCFLLCGTLLRRFFQRCGLCTRGPARRGRRSSRSGESPVVCARAAAFVIRFYIRAVVHTVLRRIVRSLRSTARLCLGSGAYSRNFGCRTALRFVCFFNGEPRRICGRDRRQASDPRFGICSRQKRPAPDHRFIHGSVSVSVGSVRIRIHRRRAYIAFSALI